ncbi:flagellar hook protein FlgE [Billgrantia gudaonensis]|uniref:Flagellar hook protein FlgE n=1 Tax=Billgrantia gudaonensis TaxID=376427 RepID=A0A1G8T3P7_9GAMM|nr:flagellar hook protein FlgE [Halomonas gudaonensis]SDJ36021.1 flagellar hook protein FlgE [Halomonas gudaonensis]
MSFSQALSGLNAQKDKLGAIGNNISNSQTVGFKGSNVQFADVFANSRIGLGTQVSSVLQNFNEGNVESTNRNLDLAISGQGFFRFQGEGGEVLYSRNGQLSMTAEGDLINAQGAQIMGYGLNAAGEVQAGGQPEPLNVSAEELAASATTDASMTLNLDSREQPGEGLSESQVFTDASDPENTQQPIDYHYSNNFTVYDSLGNPRNITVYYEKVGANTWNGSVAMDGYYNSANDFSVEFDTNGSIEQVYSAHGATAGDEIATEDLAMTFASSGTTPLNGEPAQLDFGLNLAGSSQFGNTSNTGDLSQNGYTSGTMVGISIEDDGTIMRNYSNEESRPAGQIALVNFRNEEGLVPAGDNAWTASAESGPELVGEPGTGVFGNVVSGAVETSNVDMARELVDMIVAQRAYQANSQTIKTQDELLQTAINLR